MSYHHLQLYFDGASRNNPHGPAGCGWVLYAQGNTSKILLEKQGAYLGDNISNIQAEYQGLINGLAFIRNNIDSGAYLTILGNSEVVIRQMKREYAVQNSNIKPYYNAAQSLILEIERNFHQISYVHLPRERNYEADQLANDAIQRFSARG
jgi:ribonuclease HI